MLRMAVLEHYFLSLQHNGSIKSFIPVLLGVLSAMDHLAAEFNSLPCLVKEMLACDVLGNLHGLRAFPKVTDKPFLINQYLENPGKHHQKSELTWQHAIIIKKIIVKTFVGDPGKPINVDGIGQLSDLVWGLPCSTPCRQWTVVIARALGGSWNRKTHRSGCNSFILCHFMKNHRNPYGSHMA